MWNDTRNAAVCAAINRYRQELHDYVMDGGHAADAEEPRGVEDFESIGGGPTAAGELPVAPAIQQACPNAFGNSDIYGGSYADPTP